MSSKHFSVELPLGSFSYTGSDQTVNIPLNTTRMVVEVWGAGGASKGRGNGPITRSFAGGGGGYTKATFNVTSADTLRVIVGQGGINGTPGQNLGSTYGGGGGQYLSGDTNWCSASGGGRTSVQMLNLVTSGVYDDLITAGGGGAGGVLSQWNTESALGGFGGGTTGGNSDSGTRGGRGGTQIAGGLSGTGGQLPSGFAGSKYQGGGTVTTTTGPAYYGAGGGGGYFGGGQGGNMNGGGGGSSYIHAALQTPSTSSIITQSSGVIGANKADLPSGITNIGNGGADTTTIPTGFPGFPGQPGFAIITFL